MKTKKVSLQNGVTLITNISAPCVKNVHICLSVGVGHNHETKDTLGISALFEKLLLSRVKGVIADYAGTITYYYIEVPAEKALDAISTLAEMVTSPSFTTEEINAAKAEIIQHTTDLFPIPRRQLKLLYKHTAYGNADINWDMIKYIESIYRFTNEDLQAFASKYYVAKNMALLVNGEIDVAKITQSAEKAFANLPHGKKNKVQEDIYTGGFAVIKESIQPALFYFGFDIKEVRNAELAVLIKMLNSRLERSFIGTDVSSDVRIAGYYGRRTLQISIKTQQDNTDEILELICKNIIRIKTEKASPRRMERSRNLAMADYMEIFGSQSSNSREVCWQLFSTNEMPNPSELIFQIPNVSARNVQETAEQIFNTPLTLVAYTNQPIDYDGLCVIMK